MKNLQEEQRYSSEEIADWFGIKPKTFSNFREEKLSILKQYCDFEDLGRKGIKVNKVFISEYAGKTRKIVERDFEEAWHENPNSLKFASDYIYKKNKAILKVKPITVYSVTCAVKREWYGIPKIKNGVKGTCEWVYAVIDYENKKFRYLTKEEQILRKQMLHQFFKDEGERIDEVKKLQESKKLGEISIEEYLTKSEEILGIAENGDWDEFNYQFMKVINEDCKFALELIPSAFPID